jgi:murein DD-endopeptidase MepM/ murein hydrolase activator NlpD
VRLPLFLAVLVAALVASAQAAAYPWPVKPFNKQHPIRANFGDPRTVFQLALFQNGIEGPGSFQFHNGIDIAAPDGTNVYPVVSGTAVLLDAESIAVKASDGRIFQYFHLVPVVENGAHVVAQQTLLGYIKHGAGHVHLTEIRGFRVWNPLAKGGIAPYRDTTAPTVAEVIFRRGNTLQQLDPLGVCGQISLVADAFDTPQIKISGSFAAFPIAPALLRWTLRRVGSGQVISYRTTAADFRGTLPLEPDFWRIYARGTYQNAPRFGPRQYNLMPGRFLYNLTPPGGLDTRTLPNGVYQVSVQATDMRWNTRTLNRRFTIVNQVNSDKVGAEAGCPNPPPPVPQPSAP